MKAKILIIILLLIFIMTGIVHERIVASRDKGLAEDWNANHQITGNVDMGQYSWLNQVIENRTDWPAGPVEGQIVWRSDLNQFYVYNGAAWVYYITTDGNTPFIGDQSMGDNKITLLKYPTANQDAASKLYVDTEVYTNINRCSVYFSADKVIPHNTWTTVDWNVEYFDLNDMHSNTVNPSRIYIKKDGRYLLHAQSFWASNATGARGIQVLRDVASVVIKAYGVPGGIGNPTLDVSRVVHLSEGNYVYVQVWQDSGGDLLLFHSGVSCFFEVNHIK